MNSQNPSKTKMELGNWFIPDLQFSTIGGLFLNEEQELVPGSPIYAPKIYIYTITFIITCE